MTSRERFVATMTGRPVDRVPFIKVFGGTNAVLPRWEQEEPGISGTIDRLLGFEGTYRGWAESWVNVRLSRIGPPVVVSEDEVQQVVRHQDGTVEIVQKSGDYHHHTVEWPVKSRADWERIKARHLDPDDPERFPADWNAKLPELRGREYPLQLTHGGVYGFARNMMGDEALLYACYDDPALVHDIMDTYTGMVIRIWERMVREVSFDLIELWEDMASKNGCLLSPAMFREFMRPNYERVAAFAGRHGIEIILVDSDGYTDHLALEMAAAGVTAMYPFEVQSGCDVAAVRERLPRLGVVGGLDKESMARGRGAVDREMERARDLIRMGRFIPGPDHFVLSNVAFGDYRYFMERLRDVVHTTTPGFDPVR
jgi:uroporphyrinogen-III decarboxylase